MENIKFKAILDLELESLLNYFGLLDKYNTGEVKCAICGKTINKDNLYYMKKSEAGLLFYCDQEKGSCG